MPTLMVAWLAAIGAFFVTIGLIGSFAGPMFSLLFAGGAAVYAYKHFEGKYKAELEALKNPPSQLWELPLPDAWTCMKDTLDACHVESGVSGVSNWKITSEDNTRGQIKAQINFQQALGSPTQPQIVSRTVVIYAQLSPEGDNTRVETRYEIFSPSGTGLVESVIKKTQEMMMQHVKISKGEQ